MSKLIVDSEQIRNDATQKFEVWEKEMSGMWNAMAAILATHTDKSYFGDAVDGIAKFYDDYTKALQALQNYLVGDTGSATAAFTVFSTALQIKAADVYDKAVDDDIHRQLDSLPQR